MASTDAGVFRLGVARCLCFPFVFTALCLGRPLVGQTLLRAELYMDNSVLALQSNIKLRTSIRSGVLLVVSATGAIPITLRIIMFVLIALRGAFVCPFRVFRLFVFWPPRLCASVVRPKNRTKMEICFTLRASVPSHNQQVMSMTKHLAARLRVDLLLCTFHLLFLVPCWGFLPAFRPVHSGTSHHLYLHLHVWWRCRTFRGEP